MSERELLDDVPLTRHDGSLNRDAVGWARRPLVDTSGIRSTAHTGLSARLNWGNDRWGRNKRWEYWNVITPTHILAVVVSSLDYAAVNEVWIFDRATERTWSKASTGIPAKGVVLPPRLGAGVVRANANGLAIEIISEQIAVGGGYAGAVRIVATIDDASFDVVVSRPAEHDLLAVVVPWSDRTFQYTVKDVALPAQGAVTIEGETFTVPGGESWAVLDHGRGRWPYNIRWNWGAGSGVSGGRTIGIQVGGQWTRGTGSTENAVVIDGQLHKISDELDWRHGLPGDWRSPWRVTGGGLDATLIPFYNKVTRTNLGVLAGSTDQCFGTWSGTFTPSDGATEPIEFSGIEGFAEEVHNRW